MSRTVVQVSNPAPDRVQISPAQVTGIILAGGAGSRVGGVDKGWLSWRGQPLINHVIARLQPQVGSIIVSANRNHGQYRTLGVDVVADWTPGFEGPVAGLRAAWMRCTTPWVLVVPVDAPQLAPHLLFTLAAVAMQHTSALACVACDEYGPQPLFCLLHECARPRLVQYWDKGGRSAVTWLRSIGAVECPLANAPHCFRNLNRYEDFTDEAL